MCGQCARGRLSMASVPFDQLDGFIWMNGEFVKWADAKIHVLTHGLHYASAVFEGERAYGGEIFKLTEHTERLHESARILGFKIPYSVAEIDDACRTLLQEAGFHRRLCAADRLARQRADGRLGAEQPHQLRDRHLAVAELFRPGAEAEGHPPRHGRIPPARSAHRAVASQGGRPLHDLHAVQARGRGQGLCRRDDVRLARPGRGSDRRQRLLRQGRQDPYAEARLLPRRHHPPDRRSTLPAGAASR